MKTFKFEFVKLSLIWRCTNGPRREKDKFDLNFPAGRPQGKINQIIFLLFWAAINSAIRFISSFLFSFNSFL